MWLWNSGRRNNSTVLKKLRWPTTQTYACNCDVRRRWPQATHDSTRDFKSSYSSLSQRCLARHPASRVGQSHTLRHSQHEAYCRPNLGDILDTRLLRNLILEHEKKFSDLSQSRLVNIPNVHIYFHNNHVRNSNAGYRHVILLVQFQWVVLL